LDQLLERLTAPEQLRVLDLEGCAAERYFKEHASSEALIGINWLGYVTKKYDTAQEYRHVPGYAMNWGEERLKICRSSVLYPEPGMEIDF
jgi:hypothetical protein